MAHAAEIRDVLAKIDAVLATMSWKTLLSLCVFSGAPIFNNRHSGDHSGLIG